MKFGSSSARSLLPPASVASSATAAHTLDCSGYDELIWDVEFGTNTTTNGNVAKLQVLDSDITDATGFATVAGLVGGTNSAGGFTIPAQSVTGVGTIVQFQIDLRARKRYLQLQVTPGTSGAHVLGANAQLFRYEQLPVSATQKSVVNRDATSATAVGLIVQG